MKYIKSLTATLIMSCCLQLAMAQTDSTKKTRPLFKLSLNYNSGLHYYGRTDSLKSTGFFPLAEFWITPKFYINAAPVFVNNKLQHFDYAGTVSTAGFLNATKKWITNIYITKPFYKQSSELVQSALKAQAGINLSFLNKIININAGGDIKRSNQTDYGASAGLDHLIRKQFKDNSMLIVDPSVYAYAGTQNFTNTYYQKKAGFLFFPGTTQQTTEDVQRFSILSYEVSIPVIYAKNKWQVLFTPAYVLPQNLIRINGKTELASNMFYATVGLKHIF
jgi:hypothetical protein